MTELKDKELGVLLYTPDQVAEMLHITVRTLAKWRKQKKINGIPIGHKVLYTIDQVNEFVENSKNKIRGTKI